MTFDAYRDAMSAEMDAARRELAARIDAVRQQAGELEAMVEQAREKSAAIDSYESIGRQAEFARLWVLAHERTPEWQLVLDRIDRGELSWRDIVVSQMALRMEPDVRRAYKSLDTVPSLPPERYQEIVDSVEAQFAPPAVQPRQEYRG